MPAFDFPATPDAELTTAISQQWPKSPSQAV
jgi:hypothetical protein